MSTHFLGWPWECCAALGDAKPVPHMVDIRTLRGLAGLFNSYGPPRNASRVLTVDVLVSTKI